MSNSPTAEMQVQAALKFSGTDSNGELKGVLDLETYEKQDIMLDIDKHPGSPESHVENTCNVCEDLDKLKHIDHCLSKKKEGSYLSEKLQKAELNDGKIIEPVGIYITLSNFLPQVGDPSTEGNKKPDKTWVSVPSTATTLLQK